MKLDALIEDATVDAYDESEQRAGLYTMLEDHLAILTAKVLGMGVTVERICVTDDEEIVAVCARGRSRQRGYGSSICPSRIRYRKARRGFEAYRRRGGRR